MNTNATLDDELNEESRFIEIATQILFLRNVQLARGENDRFGKFVNPVGTSHGGTTALVVVVQCVFVPGSSVDEPLL